MTCFWMIHIPAPTCWQHVAQHRDALPHVGVGGAPGIGQEGPRHETRGGILRLLWLWVNMAILLLLGIDLCFCLCVCVKLKGWLMQNTYQWPM